MGTVGRLDYNERELVVCRDAEKAEAGEEVKTGEAVEEEPAVVEEAPPVQEEEKVTHVTEINLYSDATGLAFCPEGEVSPNDRGSFVQYGGGGSCCSRGAEGILVTGFRWKVQVEGGPLV